MELKLNIYKGKDVEKTYSAETYDLTFGTMEDFIEIIDLDKLTSGTQEEFATAGAKLITGGISQLKPLLLDVFPGLTEEELRRARVKDLIRIILEILKYSIMQIQGATKGKNV